MNKLFALSFAALIGATSHSALAAEAHDSPCKTHQAKHAQAASMPHAIKHDMKHMQGGTHDMPCKACSASCKTAPSKAEPAKEAGTQHDTTHVH
ncbi:hypothetical protein SAMN05660284_00122 [Formivibrio citricus]|uniref:Uncharacterized protein n=1 Tax=Formivibrio citricus TaxID=83765 RepID=A0A1I4V4S6_9NEIS|nr:hypothetical protein [Formivibrio citricus]SFM96123.1 hypothetical protein SAMN05660284_00122 [Formivibrio citricus]